MTSYPAFSEDHFAYPDESTPEESSDLFLAPTPATEPQDTPQLAAGPPSFESAFEALDSQAEQLQTLRGTLARLHDTSAERERAMNRLEAELVASRIKVEQQRALVDDLQSELAQREQLLGSVRDAVSELGRVLDPAGAEPTPDNGPY
jgi:septal ring factor EnvC (AmiA/AmiB activator)